MHKKILFTTSHPAPYWDIIYAQVAKNSDIVVYYNRSKDVDKAWKQQKNVQGKIVKKTSLMEKYHDIKNCDFAVLGGWGQSSNLLFMFFLILYNKPFAFFSDVPDENSITTKKIRLKKLFLRFVPYLFVTGRSCKEHYQKYYDIAEDKFVIFPYGVNIPSKEDSKNLFKKVHFNKHKIKIFIANRFLERKGYKTLLEAFKLLNEKNMLGNFDITIAGQGELFEMYKKKFHLLSNAIKLVGWIEMNEYEDYLKHSDVYIHSSYFEPYGIPVIDAMLHAKLVIASDGVMSALDQIDDGVNGFIYSKYNASKLEEILINILKSETGLIEISKNAANVRDHFLIDYNLLITNSIKKINH